MFVRSGGKVRASVVNLYERMVRRVAPLRLLWRPAAIGQLLALVLGLALQIGCFPVETGPPKRPIQRDEQFEPRHVGPLTHDGQHVSFAALERPQRANAWRLRITGGNRNRSDHRPSSRLLPTSGNRPRASNEADEPIIATAGRVAGPGAGERFPSGSHIRSDDIDSHEHSECCARRSLRRMCPTRQSSSAIPKSRSGLCIRDIGVWRTRDTVYHEEAA